MAVALLEERAAPGEPEIGRVLALDGLRGIAVLAVVAFHLWPGLLPGGWAGVDVFFVLSGYLITSILARELEGSGRIRLGGFWSRRARRLLPAALAAITLVVLAARGLINSWRLSQLRGDALASIAYVANWRFIATGNSYFASGAPSPLQHLWSLAIEEQFYLLWPLLLLLIWSLCGGRRSRMALVAAGLALASAVRMATLAHAPGSRAYFGTDTCAQALLIGAALALLPSVRLASPDTRRWLRRVAPAAVLGLAIIFLFVHGGSGWLYYGGFGLIAIASAAVIASCVAGPSTGLTGSFTAPWLRSVGRVSYGLYLWHWPVIVLLTSATVGFGGLPLDLLRILVFTGLTVLSYRLLELPIRHSNQRPAQVANRSLAAIAVAVFAVLVCTAGVSAPPKQLEGKAGEIHTVRAHAAPTTPLHPISSSKHTGTAGATGSSPTDSTAAGGPALSGGVAAALPPLRVGVVGDSIGFTLAYYSGNLPGIEMNGGGTIGCGLVATTRCADWPQLWRIVGRDDPNVVVVVLGAWESLTQDTPDGKYIPGTPEARDLLLSHLNIALALLPPTTRLAVWDVPCMTAIDGSGDVPDDMRKWVNEVFGTWVALHPERASLVPISEVLCPGGIMQARIDNIELRPDGRHFNRDSAPLVWKWLAPRLFALADR